MSSSELKANLRFVISSELKASLCFVKRILTSRVAQFFFVAHLVLVVYACADKTPRNRAESNEVSTGASSMVLIAGRGFHYHYESPLVKTLWTIDLPGALLAEIIAYLPLAAISELMPPLGAYDESWLAALIFLAGSSFQWMLVGHLVERSILFYRHRPRHDERSDWPG